MTHYQILDLSLILSTVTYRYKLPLLLRGLRALVTYHRLDLPLPRGARWRSL